MTFNKLGIHALIAVLSFGLGHLLIHSSLAFGGMPEPTAITTNGQVVATAIDESADEGYLLDSGNDSVIVTDASDGSVKSTISLTSILGGVDSMSLDEGAQLLVVSSDGGGVYTVDPSTGDVDTVVEDVNVEPAGIVADTFAAGVTAYVYDKAGDELLSASSTSYSTAAGSPTTTHPAKGMSEQRNASGTTLANVVMVLPDSGNAVVFMYNRSTLATLDDTHTGVTPSDGAMTVDDAYFVSAVNSGQGELLRVNLDPAAFGFVSSAVRTYSDPAHSVAYDNGFLAVVTGSTSGTRIHVIDFGDHSTLLDVGTLDASTSQPAPATLSINVDSNYLSGDGLVYLLGNAGSGGRIGSVGEQPDDFNGAGSTIIGGNGWGTVTAGAHTSNSPHRCGGCDDDTRVDGANVNDSTNGRVDFATGEEVHIHKLFSVPGVGMDLNMDITYRSQRDHDYRYGQGWYLNHDSRMKTEPNGDESYRSGYGRHDTYVNIGANYITPQNYDTWLVVNAGARTVTDRFGKVTAYNAAGYRTSVTDRYGNSIRYTWTGDQLTSITDTRNKTYTLAYGADGRMSSITDFGGRVWAFAYDYRGRLTSITTPSTTQHPAGRVYRYSYSGNNNNAALADNLVHMWSPKGDVTQSLQYDTNDLVTKEIVGPGSWAMTYDITNSKTIVVDPSGNSTAWTYDNSGNVIQKEQFTKGLRPGEPTSYITAYTIGTVSNMVEVVVEPRGNRTEYVYDSVLNLLSTTRKETNTTSSNPSDIVEVRQYNGPHNQVSQLTDPRGNVTTFTVDPNGNTTAIARPTVTSPATQSVQESFTYDSQGRVTSATDGAGRKTDFVYHTTGVQAGWLASIIRDPAGLAITTTFAYDQFGNVTSITDPRGNTTTFTIDADNFVTEVEKPSPFNFKTKYTYDANGDLVQSEVENRDRKGVLDSTTPWITTTFAYNEVSWLTSKTAPLNTSTNGVTAYEYQGAGLISKIIDAEGDQTVIEYDERAAIFKITRGFGTSDAATVQYDYDDNGNHDATKNARGNVLTRSFDLFNRVERITNPLGNYVEYGYDKSSNATSISAFDAGDVLQAARTNHFDEINRMWKIERSRFGPGLVASTPATILKHDAGHSLIETTDPLGRKTTRTYDAAGRMLTIKDAATNEVKFTYDAAGNTTLLERVEVPTTGPSETFKTEYDFDELNRTTERREIDRLNAANILTTTFEYDSRDNLTFRTDAEGNPVRWSYDLASRMTDYERALATGPSIDVFTDSIHETIAYDKVNRMLTLTDDNFNATSYEYDAIGRAKKVTFADSKFLSRTFDANNNVATWTDQNGSVVTNVYDVRDRLVQRSITRGTGVQGTTQENFTYDALDRLTHAEDDDYQFDRIWDSVGNLLNEDQGYTTSGQEKWKAVSVGWNDAGSRINVTYPSGRLFSHTRDSIDRLTAVVEVATQATVTSLTWQGRGRPAVATHQNGTSTEYAYDGFKRVSAIEHFTASVQTFHKFDYAYDKAHNRRMEQNSFTAAWINGLPMAIKTFLAARNGKGDVYAYDMAHRMIDARYDVSNPLSEVASPGSQTYVTLINYTQDGLGNRSQVQSTPWGGSPTTTTYASDVVNQYTTVGGVTRSHDNNGNLTDDGTNLYVYDYKNRLVEVKLKSSGATIATYKYDAAGRRVEKDVGGTVTRYVLDGVRIVEEYDGSDAWQSSVVYGDRIEGRFALDIADNADVDGDGNTAEVFRFHYAQNAISSVSEMTDPTGAVVEWVTYDAYGAPTIRDQNGAIVSSSAIGNAFLFTGRVWDDESGKYYYRARTYDPEAGRFLQRDPLAYVDGLSLYQYVQCNPATKMDPMGTETMDEREARALRDQERARRAAERARRLLDNLDDIHDDLRVGRGHTETGETVDRENLPPGFEPYDPDEGEDDDEEDDGGGDDEPDERDDWSDEEWEDAKEETEKNLERELKKQEERVKREQDTIDQVRKERERRRRERIPDVLEGHGTNRPEEPLPHPHPMPPDDEDEDWIDRLLRNMEREFGPGWFLPSRMVDCW